ncbi:hypothetical protein CHS0354_033356 [Potamilus streckersoni]|uniref:Uncharacterized protein n=1 Tax=Potamilus streckersoni TaxID=2493646 RepID=A0AAE0RT85_9BIVA|nr:hypothetical protein CHS0354_033356 [Potamilus streckersoni]
MYGRNNIVYAPPLEGGHRIYPLYGGMYPRPRGPVGMLPPMGMSYRRGISGAVPGAVLGVESPYQTPGDKYGWAWGPRDRQPQPAPPSIHAPPPRSVQGPPRDFSPVQRKSNLNTRPSSMFLFGIILKEIVAALHRIYLNPKGNIYPVLNDVIGPSAYDLSGLVRGGQLGTREESVLIQELQYVVENLIYHITEIMPSTGVLGTHKKSAVFELIRSGKRFPDGYFWQVELERLQFSENGRTMNIGDAEAFLLLIGIFISRSMITTIMMKPVDYGLSNQALTEVAERNLRIVASTLLYLVRRVSASKSRDMMPMPTEIAKYLYSDDEMRHVYSRLSRTFNYAEGLLREWGTEYIRRLRQATYSSSRE